FYCEADPQEERIRLLIAFSYFDDKNVQHQALEYICYKVLRFLFLKYNTTLFYNKTAS
ncbi:unnamed protein product, partial [Adineta steineri]